MFGMGVLFLIGALSVWVCWFGASANTAVTRVEPDLHTGRCDGGSRDVPSGCRMIIRTFK